jgi:hypothetical protein
MKTDLYTKAVLTVIAISLATIALQHALPSAFAQSGIQKVAICDAAFSASCVGVRGEALKVVSK